MGKRRARSAAPSRPASLDCKVYLRKAGDALRVRQSASSSGRPHGANIFEEKGRYRRGAEDFIPLPEFWVPDAYRAKVKTPLEFVVSAVRANGANVTDAIPLARQLQNMGMPLYGMQPPTGYSMKGDAWVNS